MCHKVGIDTARAVRDALRAGFSLRGLAEKLGLPETDAAKLRWIANEEDGKVSAAYERKVRRRLGLPSNKDDRIRASLPREYENILEELRAIHGKQLTYRDVFDAGTKFLCKDCK